MKRRYRITIVVSLAVSLGLAIFTWNTSTELRLPRSARPIAAAQPGLYQVTHVNDGDTIIVATPTGEETVRLIGADTPEVKDPRKPVQCYGPEASAHTKSLLGHGESVRLAPDPDDTDRDKYGRLLRYVYLADGTLLNAELIRDGYAFAYVVFPFSRLDDFHALEDQAHAASRGLWSACQINDSQLIKQTTGAR